MKQTNQNITLEEKKGLMIPPEFLKQADLGSQVSITVQRHLITIAPRSATEKIRGIIRHTSLTSDELDEIYFQKGKL
jgi:hypothetical protein